MSGAMTCLIVKRGIEKFMHQWPLSLGLLIGMPLMAKFGLISAAFHGFSVYFTNALGFFRHAAAETGIYPAPGNAYP